MDDNEVQALLREWHKQLEKNLAEMKLRQWCLEKAIAADIPTPPVELAQQMLAFITAPFADIFNPPQS